MQSILDRLVSKISNASIDPEPSENMYMEDVFEAPVYAEILARLPNDENYLYIEHPDAILPDGTKTRKLIDLTDETIARLNPDDHAFWHQMKTIFTSTTLQQAVLQKFHTQITKRFGNTWPELVTVPIFYRDFPGYRIGVHTDAPFKVATMQLYFPKDNSQLHLGTSFHKRQNDQFELLKTNPFKPNSAYAFVRTESSWHSVKQIAAHEEKRNSLALTIYEKGYEYKSYV